MKTANQEWLWTLGICLATALLIVVPFFVLGIASGHDFEFHAASWLDVAGQWKQGIVFPRWAEWANHGFGEPRFIFYPPLSWLLGAALGTVLPWNAVPVVFIVLVQTIAGMCAFALGRSFTSRGGALFGAVCYTANPYALLIVYMRSDFAEQLATAFFPLLVLLALRVCGIVGIEDQENREKRDDRFATAELESPPKQNRALQNQTWRKWRRWRVSRNIACFATVFALVWLSNAPAGVMASYAMALLFAWGVLRQRTLWPALRGAAGLALGFGLTAFYLLPAAYEQRWVSIEQVLSSGLQPADNFLFTVTNDPEHTLFNWIASSVAIVLIVVTGAAAVAVHRKMGAFTPREAQARTPVSLKRDRGETYWQVWNALLVLSAAATALMLRPTSMLWRLLPKLRFVQFPWRWMCVLAVGYAFFLACAFARSRRIWLLPMLITFCTVSIAAVLVEQTWWDTEDLPTLRAAIADGSGFDGTDEYDPLGDDHYNLPSKAAQAVVLNSHDDEGTAPPADLRILKWTAEEKRLTISTPQAARVALRLLDYPAWQVTLNGQRINPQHGDRLAQMLIPVHAGNSEIQVRFAMTWDRRWGRAISLLSAILVSGILVPRKSAIG